MNTQYSVDDDKLILSGADLHVVAEMLGRTFGAVQDRKYRLRSGSAVRKHRSDGWTDEELGLLDTMTADGYSDKDIAAAVGRTVNAISTKRKTLRKEVEGFGVYEQQDTKTYVRGGFRMNAWGRDKSIKNIDDIEKRWSQAMRVSPTRSQGASV